MSYRLFKRIFEATKQTDTKDLFITYGKPF